MLLLVLLIAAPFSAPRLIPAVCFLCGYLFLLLLSQGGPNLLKFWKLMLLFWCFTFTVWIVIPYLRHEAWSLENAAMLATRVDAFVVASLIFVTITRIEEFTYALSRSGFPYKAAFALSLGFRLVPLFYQNLMTIVAAQKSRGVDLDSGGIFRKGQKYVPILGVLISYGVRNADLMAMSLEAKGFGYSRHRTSYLQGSAGWRDLIIALCAVAFLLFVFLSQSL